MTAASAETHRYDGDGRCVCGGMAVWFDDPDDDGFTGEGCEHGGVWPHGRRRVDCPLCEDSILAAPFARMADPTFWDRHPHGCRPDYLVHIECGEAEGYERTRTP